jgi:hypothetical protein
MLVTFLRSEVGMTVFGTNETNEWWGRIQRAAPRKFVTRSVDDGFLRGSAQSAAERMMAERVLQASFACGTFRFICSASGGRRLREQAELADPCLSRQ